MPTKSPHPRYIWQHPAWPQFTFDASALAPALDQARLEQGRLLGLLGAIGLEQANSVQSELWVQEALATAAIEGEQLNLESLRSSVAHRLNLADAPGSDRSVEGLVQVMGDALGNHSAGGGNRDGARRLRSPLGLACPIAQVPRPHLAPVQDGPT